MAMKRIFGSSKNILSIVQTYTFRKILFVSTSVAVLSIAFVSSVALWLYEAELEKQKVVDTGVVALGTAKELGEFWTRNADQMNLLVDAIATLKLQPAEFTPLFSEMVARSRSFEAVSYFSLTNGKDGPKTEELATSDPRTSGRAIEWPHAVENAMKGRDGPPACSLTQAMCRLL
jgi:hypothetical protein